jgi:hypothetical protein
VGVKNASVRKQNVPISPIAIVEECRAKELSEEFIRSDVVYSVMSVMFRSLRDQLRGLPTSMMHQLAHTHDAGDVNRLLKAAIDNRLRACVKSLETRLASRSAASTRDDSKRALQSEP